MALLPSFGLKNHAAQLTAPTGFISGRLVSPPVVAGDIPQLSQNSEHNASRHEKAPSDVARRFPKMEREKRLELSTSTLASRENGKAEFYTAV
jgi:hypothetical protein